MFPVFWRTDTAIDQGGYRCVPSLPSQNGSLLSEMRHDFLGKQRHRLLHKRRVHQPSLVEIADELVETILGLRLPGIPTTRAGQRADPDQYLLSLAASGRSLLFSQIPHW